MDFAQAKTILQSLGWNMQKQILTPANCHAITEVAVNQSQVPNQVDALNYVLNAFMNGTLVTNGALLIQP